MPALLAVDAGGTSTRAVVLEPSGRCLGVGLSGPGNPVSAGWPAVSQAVSAAVGGALDAAGTSGAAVRVVVVAMAGGGHGISGVDAQMHGAALAPLGVSPVVHVEPDLLAQYFSGTPDADGYALVAGTGAAAVRVESGAIAQVCDGLGWLLGDAGSGFWIGREVVRAVLSAVHGRGPATALTSCLVADLGLADLHLDPPELAQRIIEILYAVPPVRLARYAPLAFDPVDDEVADGIVDRATTALTDTLDAVLSVAVDGPVVMGGSVVRHQARVRDAVEEHLSALGRDHLLRLVPDGLLGAAVLAMRHAGTTVDAATFARTSSSLAALR